MEEGFRHRIALTPRSLPYDPRCTDGKLEAQASQETLAGLEANTGLLENSKFYSLPLSRFLKYLLGTNGRPRERQGTAHGHTDTLGWQRPSRLPCDLLG